VALWESEVTAKSGNLRSKGGAGIERSKGYQPREVSACQKALFGAEKDDIGVENNYFWNVKDE
jgi:hypothetical protein